MGCDLSSLKAKKPGDDEDAKKKKATGRTSPTDTDSQGCQRKPKADNDSLDIPVPAEEGGASRDGEKSDRESAAGASRPSSVVVDFIRSASRRSGHEATPSPQRPPSQVWVFDELGRDAGSAEDTSTSSSAPQLFRISPTDRAVGEVGSWQWWIDQVRRERLTRDGFSRDRLQDLQNRIVCQHDDEPTDVEVDLGRCYMERTAPYVLGTLFASPRVKEMRWVTSLRLDGNYFTDHGLGSMLATMSRANEKRTVMPLLEQLYLNNMSLDPGSVVGLLYYLFPVNVRQEKKVARRLGPIPELSADYAPRATRSPKVPLFPSLSILSLSDNPGLGTTGLASLLRWLLATHLEPHVLSALDLSRCGIDRAAQRVVDQYFRELPVAISDGRNPVMPRSLVLLGNRHGIRHEGDVSTPDEVRLVL